MIDNAAQFHFLGTSRFGRGRLLVFQEGVLMLDTGLPGWGVMRPSDLVPLLTAVPPALDLRELLAATPVAHELAHSTETPRGSASSSTSGASTPRHQSAPATAHASLSDDSSDASPSDDGDGPAPAGAWMPEPALLGWHPVEALVHVGPVTAQGLAAYHAHCATDPLAPQAFVAQLKSGQWAPGEAVDAPGVALLLAMETFGQLRVLHWPGRWEPFLAGVTLGAARACQLVSLASVAGVCDLAPVPGLERCEYVGRVSADHITVLLFDAGMLVMQHPDDALIGWHGRHRGGHWSVVSTLDAHAIERLCERTMPVQHMFFQLFRAGALDAPGGGEFVAVVWSHRLQRPVVLRVAAPAGVIAPGAPGSPDQAAARLALRQAPLARVHDRHAMEGPFSLGCGNWDTPLFLGAARWLGLDDHLATPPGHTWQATLSPLIEARLLAHRAQEAAWLASGVITLPIDRLVDLMRRDKGMRRTEVRVRWPVSMLPGLLHDLAPRLTCQVKTPPTGADVEHVLQAGGSALFVFQPPDGESLEVVVRYHGQCWYDNTWADVGTLQRRARQALAAGAPERLVALAFGA